MKIIPANAQHIGKRINQQDAFGFSDNSDQEFVEHSGFLAVLCDGMGGMALGEQASNAAVQAMLKAYMAKPEDQLIVEALEDALEKANEAVLDLAKTAGLETEVGTTIVAALVHKEQLHWVSTGDSRIYLLRDGDVTQITEDHNYAMELEVMVKREQISREQADHDPERQALVSYLGIPKLPYVSASTRPVALKAGDVVILCSDGLYGAFTPGEFKDILNNYSSDPSALIQTVLDKEHQHQDNITVTMLICEEIVSDTVRNQQGRVGRKKISRRFNLSVICSLLLLLLVTSMGVYYYYYAVYNEKHTNNIETEVVGDKQLENK